MQVTVINVNMKQACVCVCVRARALLNGKSFFNTPFACCVDVLYIYMVSVHTRSTKHCSSGELTRSGGATPPRARSDDLAGRSTALAQALAPPCLALRIALLR